MNFIVLKNERIKIQNEKLKIKEAIIFELKEKIKRDTLHSHKVATIIKIKTSEI